ncbi:MAG: glycogen debranching protein, partial [Clostridiales bacterium]|nr:glycogen debranching protein [Clostridiales bacterium]
MGTKYRLGRGSFRTYEEGIEREWLLTNGIGGLSNMSVIGAQIRMHSGYLTASFHAPADRKLLLANIHDSITIEDKNYDLTCQEYLGMRREGQKYLNSFEQDVIPCYTYQVNDFVMKKTIGMEYGENTVAIEYQLLGGRKKARVTLLPLFNYR